MEGERADVGEPGHLVDDDPQPGRVVLRRSEIGAQVGVDPRLGVRGEPSGEVGDDRGLAAVHREPGQPPDARLRGGTPLLPTL